MSNSKTYHSLRDRRKKLGLTQKQVAGMIGGPFTQSAISKMENFDYRLADPLMVKVILDKYEKSLLIGNNYG